MFGQIKSRGSKDNWTQHTEEIFLKEDLPLFCHQNKWSLRQILKNYINSIHLRKKWWPNHNPERLVAIAERVIRRPPKIWFEQKEIREGRFITTWYIQHFGENPKKVHGH
jgi:hypothetical protein|tara:strand:- start:593 stop:922 length:330 start_codon:yes stop_codon:yes gene_type:complete